MFDRSDTLSTSARPINGLLTASSDTLEYLKLVQHIFVWHVEIYIHVQYNRLVYEINKDTKFA
jgi:hypothetical protein